MYTGAIPETLYKN